jgi:hypothetical protein
MSQLAAIKRQVVNAAIGIRKNSTKESEAYDRERLSGKSRPCSAHSQPVLAGLPKIFHRTCLFSGRVLFTSAAISRSQYNQENPLKTAQA